VNSPCAKVLLRKTLVTPHLRRPPEGGIYRAALEKPQRRILLYLSLRVFCIFVM
jgi:hypothetical protein